MINTHNAISQFQVMWDPLPSPYRNSPPGLPENRRGDIRRKCLLVVNGFQSVYRVDLLGDTSFKSSKVTFRLSFLLFCPFF